MAVMINQGKHNPEVTGGEYEIIECKKVKGVIEEIKPHEYFTDKAISVTVRILEPEKYKGRKVFGDATYDPTDDFSWTYVNLRASAGAPYVEGEPNSIDIEKTLMDRIVWMKLYKKPDKKDKTKEYQGVSWIVPKEVTDKQPVKMSKEDDKKIDKALGSLDSTAPAEPSDDDDWI